MKLLLTSISISPLENLVNKPFNKINLVYIPTAADPYKNKWFIEEDRKYFREHKIPYKEIDMKNQNYSSLMDSCKYADAVFISGGNVFYLLEKTLESQFDKVIRELVKQGVIYVGASSGAVLAGTTIEPFTPLDDPSKAVHLSSYDGLHLVDFVVLPHFGNTKYKFQYQQILTNIKQQRLKHVCVKDTQAVIVEDNQCKIINVAST